MARRQTEVEVDVEKELEDGTIENKSLVVQVFEIRPTDVYKAYDAAKDRGLEVFFEDGYFLGRCTSLPLEDLKLLYPSDLEKIVTAFREVNKSFLAPWPTIKKLIAKVGLVEWLGRIVENSEIKEKIGETIAKNLGDFALDSPEEDMSESGNTDGLTS